MSDNLTPTMRKAVEQGEAERLEQRPETISSLRHDLRRARMDIGILQRKLAAANAKIEQLKASQALADALASDEPTCP